MNINVLTLFPEMFTPLQVSLLGRGQEDGKWKLNLVNFRDFSDRPHKSVDDTPYGGGAGMVLRCEPIFEAIDDLRTDNSYILLMCPTGKTYNQKKALELKNKKHIIIICGHYEGFDERIKSLADEIISIGDFVLTGGEYPSMCMMDAIIRLIPGVINKESLDSESFTNNTLDYPMYTKPYEYEGMKVPDVLISGNHQKIDEWRKEMAMKKTLEKRPDLMEDSNE